MLNMSTFFKVQMGQNRVITGVSAVDPTVRVVKRLISVKTIGFYIVSPVGKVIVNLLQQKNRICITQTLYPEYMQLIL